MRLGALFSGGKDSVFAMYKTLNDAHEIRCLITVKSENPESYMYHVPNIDLTDLQAEAMGIPLIVHKTRGVKEEELMELESGIQEAKKRFEITGIVSGAIYSNYQRKRIDNICSKLGLKSLVPLWKLKPKDMLLEMVEAGFSIIMSAVAAGGLGPEWLGRMINRETIDELTKLHNTCYVCTGGEGGEFETLVLDCPLFNKRLKILESESLWDGQAGIYNIKKAVLMNK